MSSSVIRTSAASAAGSGNRSIDDDNNSNTIEFHINRTKSIGSANNSSHSAYNSDINSYNNNSFNNIRREISLTEQDVAIIARIEQQHSQISTELQIHYYAMRTSVHQFFAFALMPVYQDYM